MAVCSHHTSRLVLFVIFFHVVSDTGSQSPQGNIFRLWRKLPQPCSGRTSPTQPHSAPGDEEDLFASDDPEELCNVSTHHRNPSVVYEIAFSTSYQVPVLYLHFQDTESSTKSLEPAQLENLIPVTLQPQIRHIGVIGAITITVSRKIRFLHFLAH